MNWALYEIRSTQNASIYIHTYTHTYIHTYTHTHTYINIGSRKKKTTLSSRQACFVIAHSSGDFTYIHTYNVARASKRHWGQGLTKCNNDFYKGIMLHDTYLRATNWARNPNLLVVITHASHVCSQHSFGLPLRMYGMHRTHFDHGRLDLLPLIWSRVFWPSVKWNLRKVKRWSKSILTFDCYRPHSVTFGYF